MTTQQTEYNKPEQLAQNQFPVGPHPPYGNQPMHHGYPGPSQHHQGQAPMVDVSNHQNMGMPMHPPPGQPYPGPPQMTAYPMGPGTGQVPSGYPAHALPGNVGTMRFPTYQGHYPPNPPIAENSPHHLQQTQMIPPNPTTDQQPPFPPEGVKASEPSDPSQSQTSHQPVVHPSDQQHYYPNSYPEHTPEQQHAFQQQYQYGYNGPEPVNYGPNFYMKDPNMPMGTGQNPQSQANMSHPMTSQPHSGHNVAPHPMPQPPQIHPQPHHQMPHPSMPQQFVTNSQPFENPHAQHMNPEYSYQPQHIMGTNPRMQAGPPNRFPCPPRPFPPMNPNVFPRGNDPRNQSPRPCLQQDTSNWQHYQQNAPPNMLPPQGYPPNMQGVPPNFAPHQDMRSNIIPQGESQAAHPQSSFGGMGHNGYVQPAPVYYSQPSPTKKPFDNTQNPNQQQNKQYYNTNVTTSPQKISQNENFSGVLQKSPHENTLPGQNISPSKVPETMEADDSQKNISSNPSSTSSSPTKNLINKSSMNNSVNFVSSVQPVENVPISKSQYEINNQKQGEVNQAVANTSSYTMIMSSQNNQGQLIFQPPPAPESHNMQGKQTGHQLLSTLNPNVATRNNALVQPNQTTKFGSSNSFPNSANNIFPQQTGNQQNINQQLLLEGQNSTGHDSNSSLQERVVNPKESNSSDLTSNGKIRNIMANTHTHASPSLYGGQHSQILHRAQVPNQGQILHPQGVPVPHHIRPRLQNTNINQGGTPHHMSEKITLTQSVNKNFQNQSNLQPLSSIGHSDVGQPLHLPSQPPKAADSQCKLNYEKPASSLTAGNVKGTSQPQYVMGQQKYPGQETARPPSNPIMGMLPQRMMTPQMVMTPHGMQAPHMVFSNQRMQAPKESIAPQNMNSPRMIMVSQGISAPVTSNVTSKKQVSHPMLMSSQCHQMSTIPMESQRIQNAQGAQGIKGNLTQPMEMNMNRMQSPQFVSSQGVPTPVLLKPQRMQTPTMVMTSMGAQNTQGIQAPTMMMVSEGMHMSPIAMASQAPTMVLAGTPMQQTPMVMASQGMQTPTMMVASQGVQGPPMVITSQGIQQQQQQVVMTSQGLQTPGIVIPSQGLQTNQMMMTSQGMQAVPMAIPVQRMQNPSNIQNRGPVMMGPPRPPHSHEHGEMPYRALIPPGVVGPHRQPGMMMAPRGMPHPRMFNPEGMNLMPRQPGMFPFRGPIPMNLVNQNGQQVPVPMQQQDKQTVTSQPTQIIPMSMAIQGSISNQPGMQLLPPGAMITSSPNANMGSMMIPPSVPGSQGKVSVPWGWKRLFLSDKIVYFSPSGIQLKSIEEIKDYLFTEGTCKCGLDCPLAVDSAFNFNPQKVSELSLPNSISVKNTGCKHLNSTLALVQIQSNTGFAVRHHHNPVFNKTKDGQKKKVKKKKKPFSGVLVSQMLAARESEKQRINEIIAQQKAQHEASIGQKEDPKSKAQIDITNQINTMQETNMLQLNLEQNISNESAEVNEDCEEETDLSIEETKLEESFINNESNNLVLECEYSTEKDIIHKLHEDATPSKPSTPTPTDMPVAPAPHLTPRMVHPAMLQTSKLMNLGNAAQIFGSENFCSQVLSPQNLSRRSSLENTPTGPQEAHRPFSLAEAMQAARRLNLDQGQGSKDGSLEHSNSTQSELNLKPKNVMHEEKDIKPDESVLRNDMAVNKNNADISAKNCDIDNGLKTCKSDQDAKSANFTNIEDSRLKGGNGESKPVKTKIEEKSDLARNIEIRRLSNTDEGNKVLEPTFHSPEKNKKKNPLENIFNIVSGMEVPSAYKVNEEEKDSRGNVQSRNSSPGLSGSSSPGIGSIRPQLKGRKNRQYSTLPPLPHSPPPWVLGGQQLVQGQNMPQMLAVQNIRGMRPTMLNDHIPMFQQQVQVSQSKSIPISGPQPIMTSSSTQMIITAPPLQLQSFVPPPVSASPNIQPTQMQPMLQLIQTVNGPMLVPMTQPIAIENGNLVQIQPAPPTIMQQTSPSGSGASSKSSSPGSITNVSPNVKKKGRKRKIDMQNSPNITPSSQVPILMSPNGNLMSFQAFPGNPPPVSSGQVLALSQPTQGTNILAPAPSPQVVPQNILVNQAGQQMILSNGTLMTVPQPQGIMYQQLPDGTLVQVQNQIPLLPQGGQQLITGAPLQGQIMINNPSPMIQGNAPQFIMTPQGLVQAIGPIAGDILPSPGPRQIITGQGIQIPRKKPKETLRKAKVKRKAKPLRLDTSMEQDPNEGVTERDSVDETDTSFEEPHPSTSKDLSPRSSIQSNKVDSSGLNATPPHQKDGDFEQLRSKSPDSDLDNSYQELDTSLDTSRHSKMSGSLTPASNTSLLEEKLIISEDDDSDMDVEEEVHHSKFVTSSSKKKKKKKKRSAEDFVREQNLRYDEETMIDSPVVPPEPREFKVGDLIWGPVNGFPSWPGKLVSGDEAGVSNSKSKDKVWVCWFGTRQISQVEGYKLKTLSEGLEAHHRERKKSRRGRKMNTSLEKAIQEAMSELD